MTRYRKKSDVEQYLIDEFREHPPAKVLAAFSHAFFDSKYEPTDNKKVWDAQLRKRAKEAPESERQQVEHEIELERIWHKNNPKTGGSDPANYSLADWVQMGFEDLNEPITFGINGHEDGKPSTRFGRVVQAVFDWRDISTDWRRAAQNVINKKRF